MDPIELILNNQDLNDFVIKQQYKLIHDSIHGYIPISNIAQRIIDNKIFQRLRKLKQLGTCVYVFPTAIHTRFEHSIGTYYLAGRLLKCITSDTDASDISKYLAAIPELENYYTRKYENIIHVLDDYIIELIKIAALCHDIGHGPFSHVFDDCFMPYVIKTPSPNDSHEVRSGVLLELIIKGDDLLSKLIKDPEIQFIKNLINPKKEHVGFLYQIVSNNLNGLDVDKYDYIVRDAYMLHQKTGFDHSRLVDQIVIIDNNICYPKQIIYESYRLFHARYELHKLIYCHKSVIAAQLMLVELFFLLDPILHISSSVDDMDRFCKMTDEYILTSIDHLTEKYCTIDEKFVENIKKAKEIIDRINKHDLYVFIGNHVSDKDTNININSYLELAGIDIKYKNDIIIFKSKIGYVSGNKKSPLDNLYTCSSKSDDNSVKLTAVKFNIEDVSNLIPNKHQEHVMMVFYKHRSNYDIIKMLRNNFMATKTKF
jgi:HD superfamily phosphohydrolase